VNSYSCVSGHIKSNSQISHDYCEYCKNIPQFCHDCWFAKFCLNNHNPSNNCIICNNVITDVIAKDHFPKVCVNCRLRIDLKFKKKEKKNNKRKEIGKIIFISATNKDETETYHKIELTTLNLFTKDIVDIISNYSELYIILQHEDTSGNKTNFFVNIIPQHYYTQNLNTWSWFLCTISIDDVKLNEHNFKFSVDCMFLFTKVRGIIKFELYQVYSSDYSFNRIVSVRNQDPKKKIKYLSVMDYGPYQEQDFNIIPFFQKFLMHTYDEILSSCNLNYDHYCKVDNNDVFSLDDYNFKVNNISDFTLIIDIIIMSAQHVHKVVS
jgi:hypothetical protein